MIHRLQPLPPILALEGTQAWLPLQPLVLLHSPVILHRLLMPALCLGSLYTSGSSSLFPVSCIYAPAILSSPEHQRAYFTQKGEIQRSRDSIFLTSSDDQIREVTCPRSQSKLLRELGLELCPHLPSELPAASSRTHSECPICPQDIPVSKLTLQNQPPGSGLCIWFREHSSRPSGLQGCWTDSQALPEDMPDLCFQRELSSISRCYFEISSKSQVNRVNKTHILL